MSRVLDFRKNGLSLGSPEVSLTAVPHHDQCERPKTLTLVLPGS